MSGKRTIAILLFFAVGLAIGVVFALNVGGGEETSSVQAEQDDGDVADDAVVADSEGEASETHIKNTPPIKTDHTSHVIEGGKAPDFSLPNADGKTVTLSELLKDGPVILSFYRGGWCPFCNDQLYAYQQILPEFEELGAQLVAVTPETPQSVQDTTSKNYLTFDVLSDAGNKVARLYDLLWTVPEDKRAEFSKWLKEETDKTLAEFNGVDNYELPIPAAFVIAQDGTVVFVFRDEDYKKRASNADIIAALKSLAAHDGEEESPAE